MAHSTFSLGSKQIRDSLRWEDFIHAKMGEKLPTASLRNGRDSLVSTSAAEAPAKQVREQLLQRIMAWTKRLLRRDLGRNFDRSFPRSNNQAIALRPEVRQDVDQELQNSSMESSK